MPLMLQRRGSSETLFKYYMSESKLVYRFGILGGTNYPETGTFAEYIAVDRNQVILAPGFIDSEHLAGKIL